MSTTTGVSVERFLAGDWPQGAELVEGEVIVNDPTFWHQRIALRIASALLAWTRAEPGRGAAGFAGNWTLAAGATYKPDAWWVGEAHAPARDAIRSDSPPDLVVEVRSPGTWSLDIGPKRAVYERVGVAELWLVDTPARVVLVNRRRSVDAPAFDVVAEVASGEVLTTPLLSGFELPVDEVFA